MSGGYSPLYDAEYAFYEDDTTTGTVGIYSDLYSDLYGTAGAGTGGGGGGGGGSGTPGGPYGWRPSWGRPFYGGQATTIQSVPWPFPIALAGHGYAIDLKQYQRETVDVFRTAQDTGVEPGENTLNPAGAWKRNRDDWSLGAGLKWVDRLRSDPDITPRRFWKSKGVDVWTFNELTLLPDTEHYLDAPTAPKLQLLPVGAYLYQTQGNLLQYTLDPQQGTPTFVNVDMGANIVDITSDGTNVYCSVAGVGIRYVALGDASVHTLGGAADTYLADILEYANGWLFAAHNNEIATFSASGAKTIVQTHPNASFKYVAVIGTQAFIYFGGQAQDLAEIYSVQADNTGALAVPILAGKLARGEILRSMEYYGNVVLVCTSKGLHEATVSLTVTSVGNGSLAIGPRIPVGDIRCSYGDDKFIWFGWSNYDTTSTGLGRVNLAEDTQVQTPAYASDLMFTGQGQVTTVVRFRDMTYFGVAGVGYIRESVNLVEQGNLTIGRLRWGAYEPKAILGAELVTEPLTGAIAINATLDDGSTVQIGQRLVQNTTGTGEILGVGKTNKTTDWLEPEIQLARSVLRADEGPTVLRFTARALPVPKQVETFTLPIILTDMVDLGDGGQDRIQDTRAEYDYLRSLHHNGVPVTLQIGDKTYIVTVRKVMWPQGGITSWNTKKTGLQGTCMVTAITAEI